MMIPREMVCQKDEIWMVRGMSERSLTRRRINLVKKGVVRGPIPDQGLNVRG